MRHSRPLGLNGDISVPWGSHLLGLFESRRALDDAAALYFEAGLAAGEACIWIAAEEGRARLRGAAQRIAPLVARYVETDRLRIESFREWAFPAGRLDSRSFVQRFRDAALAAQSGDMSGVRVLAEIDLRTQGEIDQFVDHEEQTGLTLHTLNVIAACAYPLQTLDRPALLHLVRSHDRRLFLPDSLVTFYTHEVPAGF